MQPRRRIVSAIIVGFLFVVILSLFTAHTASVSIPSGSFNEYALPVVPSDFLPDICKDNGITSVDNLVVVTGGGWTEGTLQSDLILGNEQDNQLRARGDDDCVLGGDGADRIVGNPGNDVLVGGDGNDNIAGGAGDDIIFAGGGRDTVNGNGGYDICYGGGGGDRPNEFNCEEEYFP